MKIRWTLLYFTTLFLFLTACEENYPVDPCGENGEMCQYQEGVFIVNEGQFLAGNGSITFYDPVTKLVETGIFNKVNNRQLGDIAQSMTITDAAAFIVVNNSQKIEMVNPVNFESMGSLTGFTSPRYIHLVSSTKAYVSDIAGKLFVVNPSTGEIVKTIATEGWTESMAMVGEELFVVQRTSYLVGTAVSNVIVVNIVSDEVIREIDVPANPSSIALDADQNVWVLCSGDSLESSTLIVINPVLKKVFRSISLEDKTLFGGPSELISNKEGTHLFYLNNGLYRISMQDLSEPAAPLILPPYSIYDFSLDPSNGDIYCTDAVDFVQRGSVYRYSANGSLMDQFEVGIAPGDFAFN